MAELKRYLLAGTGARGIGMYARPLLKDFPQTAGLVGLFDVNPARLTAANDLLGVRLPLFTDFNRALTELNPDGVIIATRDSTHEEYVIRTLEAGKRAYSEKPLCTTAEHCRNISVAAHRSSGEGFVTHNMRYVPAVSELKRLLDGGKIGDLRAMEFRENLDRFHGAGYFRRWHRHKASSGGLLVHKASHHFDVLNWFAGGLPERLVATGATVFYGKNGPFRHQRCRGCPHAEACEFHVDLFDNERNRKLYLEAEKEDGYLRDGCVFDESIDAEDQTSVFYSYDNNVRVTYTLSAFASYEGILMTLEGTEGRLEYETAHRTGPGKGPKRDLGEDTPARQRLTYFHPRKGIEQLEIPRAEGGHGGSDPALRSDFFQRPWDARRPNRMATLEDAFIRGKGG